MLTVKENLCILEAFKDGEINVMVHQVNCQGKMASGIAGQIAKAYPKHKEEFLREYGYNNYLGNSVMTIYYDEARGSRNYVAGVYGQNHYGRDGKRYTNYAALFSGIDEIINYTLEWDDKPTKVGIPWGIGCGLGGGDWNIVYPLLKDLSEIYNEIDFIIYKK